MNVWRMYSNSNVLKFGYKAQVEAFTPVPVHPTSMPTAPHSPYPSLDPPAYEAGGVSNPAYGSGSSGDTSLALAYPSLREFMGLELSEAVIRANMPEYLDDFAIVSRQPESG